MLTEDEVQEKPVTDVPGIRPVLGQQLAQRGFDKSYCVVGQFLLLKKNEDMFVTWLRRICDATAYEGRECYRAVVGDCPLGVYPHFHFVENYHQQATTLSFGPWYLLTHVHITFFLIRYHDDFWTSVLCSKAN